MQVSPRKQDEGEDGSQDESFEVKKVIPFSLDLFFNFVGISFRFARNWWTRSMFLVFLLRMSVTVIYEIYFTLNKQVKVIEFISNICVFIFPLFEFSFVHFKLEKVSGKLNEFTKKLTIEPDEIKCLARSLRKMSTICILFITIQGFLFFSMGVTVINSKHNWLVNRTLPFDQGNSTTNKVIALVSYVYEVIATNYIAISASIYLCYFKVLLFIKNSVIKTIDPFNPLQSQCLLDQLDELMDQVESIMSILPGDWLVYGLLSGATFILSLMAPDVVIGENWIERTISITVHINDILAVVVVLLCICLWQEQFIQSVKLWHRNTRHRMLRKIHFRLADRIDEVLKRPVSLWFIRPIDRSAIVAYIGSTITFSTLFIQIEKNGC